MGADPRLLDDIAKVAGGAVNIFSGMQEQFREEIRSRMDEIATRMDLVPREDLDQAIAMIMKLQKRVDTLEADVGKVSKKAPSKKNGTTKKTKKG